MQGRCMAVLLPLSCGATHLNIPEGVTMLDQQYQEVLARCRLHALPSAILERMTADSAMLDVPEGTVLHHIGSTSLFLCVIAEGTLRTCLISEQGKQITVRYSRPGDLVGLAGVYAGQSPRMSIQAVTGSRLLLLRPETVRKLAAADAGLANVLLADLAEQATAYLGAELLTRGARRAGPGGPVKKYGVASARLAPAAGPACQPGECAVRCCTYRTGPRSHRAGRAVAGVGIALAAETAGRPRSSTAAAAAASDIAATLVS